MKNFDSYLMNKCIKSGYSRVLGRIYRGVSGFTLVELIITIVILIILIFIAFFSFSSQVRDARNYSRVSDIETLKAVLTSYIIKAGRYPEPTNGTDIFYSGALVWTQGTFGESTFANVGILSNIPHDPVSSSEYSYSLHWNKHDYELASVYEGADNLSYNPIIEKANAFGTPVVAYTDGSYNGILTRIKLSSKDFILALPSITSNDLSDIDLDNIVSNQNLVYKNFGNLPESYKGSLYSVNEGSFNFSPSDLVVFSGSMSGLKTDENRAVLLKNLQIAYSGTTLILDTPEILNIKDAVIDIDLPSKYILSFACDLVNNKLNYPTNCEDEVLILYYVTDLLHIDISGLPSTTINSVFQDNVGNIWFGTNAGIGVYDGSTWTIYDTSNSGLVHNKVLSISQDNTGDMWFGTNIGISNFDGSTWISYNTGNSGLLHNNVSYIYTSSNGTIWFGTNKGVSSYGSDTWDDYTKKKTGISHNHVTAIFEDTSGNIWFGTNVGLDKYYSDGNSSTITTYTTSNTPELGSNSITYINSDSSGNLWFGTDNGLTKFDGSTWTYFNTLDGLVSNNITYIYEDSSNNLWFGTTSGLSKYDGSWTSYTSAGLLDGDIISSISQDNNTGNMIIITEGGITILN